ncbi:hypothetical protein EXIGLDRAFT_720926 [Exidia glandulosa HHB12029]|uniref:Uncharacterized protein n=1 Tax=Exidia glandulosa HHB12029 TaxID=1314781 RepID=A0A165NG30_EXIGL|nr:hypothetical protein EXIGLDRAFT_720926 [Exidia glandulosa HHB12029]
MDAVLRMTYSKMGSITSVTDLRMRYQRHRCCCCSSRTLAPSATAHRHHVQETTSL